MNRRAQPVPPVRDAALDSRVDTRLPAAPAGAAGEDWAAAHAAFGRIGAQLAAFADEQARTEGSIAGASAGAQDGYAPTGSATIRGRAYDAAGNSAYQARVQAGFASDALDLLQTHRDDPAAFKGAYETLTKSYRDRVAATGPHLVGDFETRATTLGAQLRMKVADAFDGKQKDAARGRLYESLQAHQTTVTRLAVGDPDGPATMQQAEAGLKSLDAQIDAMVAADQLTPEQAARQKRAARADTLLTLYGERADRLTDPAAVGKLREQLRADFRAGRMPMLDGDAFQKLDAGLEQLSRRKTTEATAARTALGKEIDDFVERNSKALTPPAGEWAALEQKAQALGPAGTALLAEAKGKLQVETVMRRMGASERAAYLARLEDEARRGLQSDDPGARIKAKFEARGFSPVAAAALAGQALAESRGRTTTTNPGDGRDGSDSIGLLQWNADRAQRLKAFAAAQGKPATDEDVQIDFAAHELATTERARGDALKSATDLRAASHAVISYLRPAGWSEANPEAGHNWEGRLANAQRLAAAGGVTAPAARLVEYARSTHQRIARLESDDPLTAAEQAGTMPGGAAAALDLADPSRLAEAMKARVAQAQAVGAAYQRSPRFFRPAEAQALGEALQAGGQKALDTVDAVIAGAGASAPAALAEIGEGAPELAHAAVVALQTGDDRLKKMVAAALEARRVKGAPALPQPGAELDAALTRLGGDALRAAAPAQGQRLRQTVALAFGLAAQRRGVDPKSGDGAALIDEIAQMALGRTRRDGIDYGGLADYALAGTGWLRDARVKILVPSDVKAARVGDVLRAVTDSDLAALPDPPARAGKPLAAAELMRLQPFAGSGGYRFGEIDPETKQISYVHAKSGAPFFLDWATIAPALRKRVPDAFR